MNPINNGYLDLQDDPEDFMALIDSAPGLNREFLDLLFEQLGQKDESNNSIYIQPKNIKQMPNEEKSLGRRISNISQKRKFSEI